MISNETRNRSGTFRLRVWGDNACFTRPEMKVERVSYDVMTPSAARGILEAILWKPAFRWVIQQIDVLKPIRWESVRRNEVGAVVSARSAQTAMKTGRGRLGLYVERERQQRAGLFLRDVAYVIHALMETTSALGPDETLTKFQEMFLRRAAKGQCFTQPYLGCREFSASFSPVPRNEKGPKPIEVDADLGWMLLDFQDDSESAQPLFFRAQLENGSLHSMK